MAHKRKRLALINIERDNLLAQLDDDQMTVTNHGLIAIIKRNVRRDIERRLITSGHMQHLIPPGLWDHDCDVYPAGDDYPLDLGDGYKGVLRRHTMAWYWCVYVQLPEGHRCIGKSYEDDELRDAPFELTWSEGNEFGLDHGRSWDGKPHIHYSEFTPEYELRNSGKYTTYDDAVAEAKELKAFFVSKA